MTKPNTLSTQCRLCTIAPYSYIELLYLHRLSVSASVGVSTDLTSSVNDFNYFSPPEGEEFQPSTNETIIKKCFFIYIHCRFYELHS